MVTLALTMTILRYFRLAVKVSIIALALLANSATAMPVMATSPPPVPAPKTLPGPKTATSVTAAKASMPAQSPTA